MKHLVIERLTRISVCIWYKVGVCQCLGYICQDKKKITCENLLLSYDLESESEIRPCIKIH